MYIILANCGGPAGLLYYYYYYNYYDDDDGGDIPEGRT
jgi:hypothetical protein